MQGFRLGSIFGFEIRVDLSWFLIFFLVLWTLSAGIFPTSYPGFGNATYFGMGIVATLLFFASLLAHELSHTFVARAKGIPVEGITLFIFGGVSRTRMDAETPGDEFQIAGVGPLVSLLLAGFFGLIWYVGINAGWSVVFTGIFAYLAVINLALAIFNMLPGFPLDGGRVFRSMIWKYTGNIKKATKIASTGGKWLAYLLIAFGALEMFAGAILGGLWLILIGWFLYNAAETSYEELLLRTSLKGVKAREIMTPHPETVSPEMNLQELVDTYFLSRRYHSFPVTQDSHPVGIITLNQVKDIPREEWKYRTVKDTMIPVENRVTARPEEQMSQVLQKMQDSGVRRVLVIQNDLLRGIITAHDLANWLQRQRDLDQVT
ncbi:site-2 protease family protein [Nodularia spumigena CS-584]|jgi:Zn-dependent protease/CBS domain-containing protein|uniref:Zinc metalloprotease n=2 Tax=Nodularia spumigena TaxID=70799 RepID=A0A2S0Q5Y8_NODSP|nr:site-2 protease family protein [Nodularia spumigena]AHJ28938.1 putative metalloprotease/ CBS domain protein [Nodularia spumigena CCY9414]AVZ29742.1 putative zinc metalloprotease Rip3 [Nodularia spumigena UHCC 0039]EAW45365.1 protease family protein [Nodularia spumigena CCY9414]MDB9382848.1 site-2 protease family protein [Nodularia spumigena CS-584]MEA5525265.1 site-2 protease family protein [Nodularia spumigena UHCC 0143]